MNIGENLKKIRKLNKMTQEQLANELYYSCQSISNWERNLSVPPLQVILYLSRKYGFPLNEFFSDKHLDKKIKTEIYNISILLLKENKKLSLDNLVMYSNIDKYKLTDFFNNDEQLISFVMEEFEKNIEYNILNNAVLYNSYYDFILDYIVYLIYDNKEIVSLFYKHEYIAKMWKEYLVEKYSFILMDKFYTYNNPKLFVKIIIELFQDWLINKPILDIDHFRSKLTTILNTNVRFL